MQEYIAQYPQAKNFITFADFHLNGSHFYNHKTLYETLIAPDKVDFKKSSFRVFKYLPEKNNPFIQSKSLIESDETIPLYYPDEEEEKIMFKEEKK